MKTLKNNPLAFLLFTTTIVLTCFSLILLVELLLNLKNQQITAINHKNELQGIINKLAKIQEENVTLSSLVKKNQGYKAVKCPSIPEDRKNVIYSSDNKYFYYFKGPNYSLCDNTATQNPIEISHFEAKAQNGTWHVNTIYGELLFYANIKDRTLKYLSKQDFPFVVSDMYFFGPQANDLTAFSPDSNKVVFGIGDGCHDCDINPLYYVLNMKSGSLTKLGTASNWEWIDNDTIKWMELSIRERTKEEHDKDPYGFPVVIEEKGYVTTNVL